ncbi:formyl peptide receptor-related sequence 4-like [Ranitomeya imitator]|uniref:formyl peptide receptor-related sequence 4-like n=1 Tax=Ranitomeya imitator TaxID=111125 RepID=UPI0037E85A90
MNNSSINGTYDNRDNSSMYINLQIFRLVVHVMVYILGTTGNGMVIWFCIFRMKKTVNIVWILNLAITDFTFTFFLPLKISYLALRNQWLFGNFMCKSYWFLYYLNLSVSVLQLVVISADRYICVYFPVWCKNHRRSKLAVNIAILLWFIAIPFNVQYFLIRNIDRDQNKITCLNSLQKDYTWKAIVNPIFLFFLPFTIIVLCYVAIAVRIKRRGIVKSSRPFKIFLAVIILFFLCFFPYNLFLVLQHYGPQKFSKVNESRKQIAKSLMIANSCINPIVYVLFGKNFKEKILVSLYSVFKKALMEDLEKEACREQERVKEGDVNSCVVFEAESIG